MKNPLLISFLLISMTSFGQKYLHCGKIIETEKGIVLKEHTITVVNDLITAVTPGYITDSASYEVVDLKQMTVMPGFIDLHVHMELEMNRNAYLSRFTSNPEDRAFHSVVFAKTTLEAGFTTVRDLGGTGVNTALRNAISNGTIDGPRIFSAGKALSITGGHADPTNGYSRKLVGNPGPQEGVVNGVDDGRAAVRHRYKSGADCIKVTATGGVLSLAKDSKGPHFSIEELSMIVNTAKDLGMHVAAHAHGNEGMRRAVLAGVRTIEHGTFMSEEVMDLMIERGTWYVPTIMAGHSVADSAEKKNYFPPLIVPKALEVGPKIQSTYEKALKKGVKIAFGTDAGVFKHGKNAIEFQHMVHGGMTPMQAIQSATISGAQVLDLEDTIGKIKAGYQADIVAVYFDPLKDIASLTNINFVMKGGVIYKSIIK